MTGGHKQLHGLRQYSLIPVWSNLLYTYLVTMALGKVRSFLEYASYTSYEDRGTFPCENSKLTWYINGHRPVPHGTEVLQCSQLQPGFRGESSAMQQ